MDHTSGSEVQPVLSKFQGMQASQLGSKVQATWAIEQVPWDCLACPELIFLAVFA